jgi:large subunit ribosomal protein LP1
LDAANVDVEPIWCNLVARFLEVKNLGDLLCNVGSVSSAAPAAAATSTGAASSGSAPAASVKEEKKPEKKEESDEDMGFGNLYQDDFLSILIFFLVRSL